MIRRSRRPPCFWQKNSKQAVINWFMQIPCGKAEIYYAVLHIRNNYSHRLSRVGRLFESALDWGHLLRHNKCTANKTNFTPHSYSGRVCFTTEIKKKSGRKKCHFNFKGTQTFEVHNSILGVYDQKSKFMRETWLGKDR